MKKEITVYDKEYTSWVQELKDRYLSQQLKAHSAIMNYCLEFYWSVGKDIVSNRPQLVDDLWCVPWGHLSYIIARENLPLRLAV